MIDEPTEGTYEAPKAEELDTGGRPGDTAAGVS